MAQNNKDATLILASRKRLLKAAAYDNHQLFAEYGTSAEGHSENMVELMREKYGANVISVKKGNTMLSMFVHSFFNPFSIVLFILAVVSFVTDYILAAPESRNFAPALIVVIMIVSSGVLRFFQEAKSGKQAERLQEMVQTIVDVQRFPGGRVQIPMDELVAGDIVYLAAGDMIPSDIRIIYAKDLFVSQAAMTGESEPVEKFEKASSEQFNNPLDFNNLAFMGSNVVSGSARGLVISVGNDTIFGSLAGYISKKKPPSAFDKGVNSVSWVLIRVMLIMVPIVLFANGFTKGDWLQSILFAISVAVGITPELLPMIISANLAKGAVVMSQNDVIVKELSAIQNFGAMDILCTDKTGTLTQDRVVLEYSLDIHGKEDPRVLRHAFLNSYHQTGLRNLMDLAIINHAGDRGMEGLTSEYEKVDEIPFDFNRRRMSVAVADKDDKTQLITKGAIEEMLSVCSQVEYENEVTELTPELREEILSAVAHYNGNGMRVLGIAQKSGFTPQTVFSVEDEDDMVLIGFLAFFDPPKDSAAHAVATLSEYGVTIKILTGDNDAVTKSVCRQIGLEIENPLIGAVVESMDDSQLERAVDETNVFAKLSPQQKARIVAALRRKGHTVGFMGDGINDAPAMREADVGISVDTAVDIAKESANIILLEKDLMVLEKGVIEGRKTHGNMIKYIKMTASSNFGNMFSVLVASVFLPFLPMLPMHLLVLNLIYDISCSTIPWDNIDADYLKVPRRWDARSITQFMVWIGPVSSIFDIITYCVMYFAIGPYVFGGMYNALPLVAQGHFEALFHSGWFVQSLWSQTLIIHMIRTPYLPFIQSRASWQLTAMTTLGILVGTLLPYSWAGQALKMYPMPLVYFPFLIATVVVYMLATTVAKKAFIRRYGELL
ncbi:MAG: magnesium-translocating P-type ATPase [Brevinema sp.]